MGRTLLATILASITIVAPPSSRLVDVLVFGQHMLVDGKLNGFEPAVQAEVDEYIARVKRYHSKLARPAEMESMVYKARVNYERLLAATTTDPRGPSLAASYVLTLRPCYEWEGYHDCPEREAIFADRYQQTHPDGPFRDFLPLLAAHRWLCTAEAYVYEKQPEGERRARDAYEKDIAIAPRSASMLMRAGADALAARDRCIGADRPAQF